MDSSIGLKDKTAAVVIRQFKPVHCIVHRHHQQLVYRVCSTYSLHSILAAMRSDLARYRTYILCVATDCVSAVEAGVGRY